MVTLLPLALSAPVLGFGAVLLGEADPSFTSSSSISCFLC